MRNKITNIHNQTHRSGFSYIEVLISLFLVSMALVLMHAAQNVLLLNRTAKDRELAVRIAVSQLEALRHMPVASLPSSGSFAHGSLSDLPSGVATMELTDFNDSTKQVVVRVVWTEPHNSAVQQSVVLTTLIAENGI